MFPDNLSCCATADALQDIIHVVAVVNALHPERDPHTAEHQSFHIHERLRNNTTNLLADSLEIFTLIERKRSTPALEGKCAPQVSWTSDGTSICCDVVHLVARECGEERIARAYASSSSHSFCAQRSVVSSVIKSLMNGVTSQLQSCCSETSSANELSFCIIVSTKWNLFAGERVELQHHCLIEIEPLEALRFAKQFKLHCISSHRMFVLLRLFKTASSVFCVSHLHELRRGDTSALRFELGRSNLMAAPHYHHL